MKMGSKNKFVKFISILLVIAILVPAVLFSGPKKAEAFWGGFVADFFAPLISASTASGAASGVTSTAISLKNVALEIARQITMTITRRFLQEITKSTINWVNTGNFGNPLFVQNPESFFKDIAKFEIRNVVDMFGYDSLRYPFGKNFALNTINAYKQTAADNAQYTLSKVIYDPYLLDQYRNDFNYGGWDAFLINTQYPQNNYIGFNMIATEQLAAKLQGTSQNAAQKVQTALQQGMGFLSPQTCADNNGNNAYNRSVTNQFKRPSFDYNAYLKTHPFDFEADKSDQLYAIKYQHNVDNAKLEWDTNNTCKNLVATTPGSVVASQITNAMGSTFRQSELGQALGNSMSAILDAMLNRLLDKGLTSLASTTNLQPTQDTWSYNGQTLGSPTDGGVNSTWDSGPDQPIILKEFKKAVDTGITDTETELALIDNNSLVSPGVTQMFTSIWTKTRDLDICQPGPDIGWKDRVDSEEQRNELLFTDKLSDSDGEKAAKAKATQGELKFAVNFFKDWVNNQMMTALPNSVEYMDSIDSLPAVQQQADELINAGRLKKQALARLKSIKAILDTITTQPDAGSGREKILLDLAVQFRATQNDLSNSVTIANREDELHKAQEQFAKLVSQTNECRAQRTATGWSNPGGASSTFSASTRASCTENAAMSIIKPLSSTMTPGQNYEFTVRMINNGESYWYNGDYFQFVKKSGNIDISPSFGGILYPVAANSSDPSARFADFTFSITAPSTPGNYSLELQMVHKGGNPYVRLLDDSKTPRGTDICGNVTPSADVYFGDTGAFSMSVAGGKVQNVTSNITQVPAENAAAVPASTLPSGKEEELFCDGPIAGGYDHEMFKHSNDTGGHGISGRNNGGNGSVTYPDIPYVNADDVMTWKTAGSILGSIFTLGGADTKHHVDIGLNCNIIYKANVLDYKGSLPGGTPVTDNYQDSYPIDTTGGNECSPPPTAAQAAESQSAIDFMIPLLNAIPPMSPIVTPPTQSYKDAVQAIVDQANTKYPSVGIVYGTYSDENTIAMIFYYLVGPASATSKPVSNIIPVGDTWRSAQRVTCP